MAHGLIPTVKNQKVEDVGNTIWKELCWRSFFQEEKENKDWVDEVYTTCKMHDLMHDLAQSIMKEECYTMDANSSTDDLGHEIRHLTIMVDQLNNKSVCSLKKIRGLQSIMLNGKDDGKVKKEILSVLKELPSLRVLKLRNIAKYQNLHHVGGLKHLRYLNISHSDITTLPNGICDLLNLPTLKLNYCYDLESLPINMKDLINLRHLYLENCSGLKYMPGGMGRLKHLKTLSLLVIGMKKRDYQLDELKELDISGSLKIKNLGRVSDASIARGVSMAKRSSINKLELDWTSDDYDDEDDDNERKSTRHEKIGEALEVSTTRLKILIMSGYKGMNLPKWVGKPYSSLTRLELWGLDNVNTIASSSNDNKVIVLFPLLEKLVIGLMNNLRELVSPSCWSITGAFPNLCKLYIYDCPKLGRLPPHLKALKDVIVDVKCSDELLYSILNLNGLTHLTLSGLNNHGDHIFSVNNMNTSASSDDMNGMEVVLLPSLEIFTIREMKNLRELVSPTIIPSTGAFPNLCSLRIDNCPKLGALPVLHLKALKDVSVSGECSNELLYSISNLSALTHLKIYRMGERRVLFGVGKTLMFDNNEAQRRQSTFQSLQHLEISSCHKLRRLFDEGMIMQEETLKISDRQNQQKYHHLLQGQRKRTRGLINSLTQLTIYECPELMISLEEFRNLNINDSIQRFCIMDCTKLVSSKDEEADDFIALLSTLRARLDPKNFYVDIIPE
ncbi:putative disease resistance protein RGA1 [Impatiens glandulifera]|uniref:putative disease resistance protein RGA1 n=1 Tax=Impatiens glandulifera TaxID=253017 RepID=UPI001FB0E4CA|nr:putative disease resistance protein RGA1 [Impatiens glandulifera]